MHAQEERRLGEDRGAEGSSNKYSETNGFEFYAAVCAMPTGFYLPSLRIHPAPCRPARAAARAGSRRGSLMARPKTGRKGRQGTATFLRLPHYVFRSKEFCELSPRAVKLLIDMALQFSGANNGRLSAAWTVMRASGWSSSDQLHKALSELLDRGWLLRTRQGGRRVASLYALTWMAVDEGPVRLDVPPTREPLNLWRRPARLDDQSTMSRRSVVEFRTIDGVTIQ
ncbi:MAG: hypothetical protein KIS79_06295 [Burkholderiales bacterium]|nr:hypothetical protein [Burkholderiales bacterium]